LGDRIKKNKNGGACSVYGLGGRCIRGMVGKPEEKIHLKDPGVNGKIIVK
jgi:hypothetical protein